MLIRIVKPNPPHYKFTIYQKWWDKCLAEGTILEVKIATDQDVSLKVLEEVYPGMRWLIANTSEGWVIPLDHVEILYEN